MPRAESIEEQDDDTSLIAFSMNLFDIVGINQTTAVKT